MNKVVTLVALLGLTLNSFALAADTKTDTTGSNSNATSAESTAANKSAHQGQGQHIESMNAVTSLSSLTDKQKQQINAIYANNKAQYDSLQKQIHALRETEWSQVKPLLTPEQLTELRKNHHGHHKRNGDAPAADTSSKQDAPAAPAGK
jgi:Spy/CpxP family protein refolding chaperone